MRIPPILTRNPIPTWTARRRPQSGPNSSSTPSLTSSSPRGSLSSLPPPAYNVILHPPSEMVDQHDKSGALVSVSGELTAVGATPSGAGEEGVDRQISTSKKQGGNSDIPVMVMVREDYLLVRASIRDLDYKLALRKAMRRVYYIIVVLTVLMSVKHTVIVNFLHPITWRIRRWPGGFLIPIALLVVVSFPPLMGHELIGLLSGLVWGLSQGFGILAAGTFLGEIATWIAFKWCCTARAQKLYASLTQLIREKSFMFVLILRFSAVPGHITTAVSASAGADFGSYLLAAFLTLPKQLVIVYLGTSFGEHSLKTTIISWVATGATFVGTVVAACYIYYQMRLVLRRQALSLPTQSTSEENLAHAEVSMIEVRTDEKGKNRSIDVFLSDPHLRHPWVPSRSGGEPLDEFFRSRDLRSASLPGLATDAELRQWVNSIDSALVHSQDPSEIQVHQSFSGSQAGPSRFRQNHPFLDNIFHPHYSFHRKDASLSGGHTPLSAIPQSPPDISHSQPFFQGPTETACQPSLRRERRNSSPTSPTLFGNGKGKEIDPIVSEAAEPSRGAFSLDIQRTPTKRFHVAGGREIADEADEYAITKGARRPDLSRLRGESRAALLGRPDEIV